MCKHAEGSNLAWTRHFYGQVSWGGFAYDLASVNTFFPPSFCTVFGAIFCSLGAPVCVHFVKFRSSGIVNHMDFSFVFVGGCIDA